MMRSDPHPSSTAENSRFSMMAVTAIHQRLANAEARVGGMVPKVRCKGQDRRREMWTAERVEGRRERCWTEPP